MAEIAQKNEPLVGSLHGVRHPAALQRLEERQSLERTRLRIPPAQDARGPEHLLEQFQDPLDPLLDPCGQALDAEVVSVPVHDEPREKIPFPVNQAIGHLDGKDASPERLRHLDPVAHEVRVDGTDVARVEADRDQGMRVVEADADRLATMIQDHDFVPGPQPVLDRLDFIAEDPGMAGAQTALLIFREADGRLQRFSDGTLGDLAGMRRASFAAPAAGSASENPR